MSVEATVFASRGNVVESEHRVAISIVDAGGARLFEAGDGSRPVCLRSTAKPFVGAALVDLGIHEQFGWSDAELAIICGSHYGESEHQRVVRSILEKGGIPESALLCGAHVPKDTDHAAHLTRLGMQPLPIHNNCSGQHAGLLCFASLSEAAEAYIDPGHPIHRAYEQLLSRVFDVDFTQVPRLVDGCCLPTVALPLSSVALGIARLADPSRLQSQDKAALHTVRNAMTARPYYVGGSASFDTALMQSSPDIVAKIGADAIYGFGIISRGVGVAFKVLDGSPRVIPLIVQTLLRALGAATERTDTAISPFVGPIRNAAGSVVGDFFMPDIAPIGLA